MSIITSGELVMEAGAVVSCNALHRYENFGSDSGGSILVQAATMSGSGALSASGSRGVYPGGGGRIAVHLSNQTHAEFQAAWSGSIHANPGTKEEVPGANHAGAGTVYIQASDGAALTVSAEAALGDGPRPATSVDTTLLPSQGLIRLAVDRAALHLLGTGMLSAATLGGSSLGSVTFEEPSAAVVVPLPPGGDVCATATATLPSFPHNREPTIFALAADTATSGPGVGGSRDIVGTVVSPLTRPSAVACDFMVPGTSMRVPAAAVAVVQGSCQATNFICTAPSVSHGSAEVRFTFDAQAMPAVASRPPHWYRFAPGATCDVFTRNETQPRSALPRGCSIAALGNGTCDAACNVRECSYDNRDCAGADSLEAAFFVHPTNGNDMATGLEADPLATIAMAVDLACHGFVHCARVYLLPGEYPCHATAFNVSHHVLKLSAAPGVGKSAVVLSACAGDTGMRVDAAELSLERVTLHTSLQLHMAVANVTRSAVAAPIVCEHCRLTLEQVDVLPGSSVVTLSTHDGMLLDATCRGHATEFLHSPWCAQVSGNVFVESCTAMSPCGVGTLVLVAATQLLTPQGSVVAQLGGAQHVPLNVNAAAVERVLLAHPGTPNVAPLLHAWAFQPPAAASSDELLRVHGAGGVRLSEVAFHAHTSVLTLAALVKPQSAAADCRVTAAYAESRWAVDVVDCAVVGPALAATAPALAAVTSDNQAFSGVAVAMRRCSFTASLRSARALWCSGLGANVLLEQVQIAGIASAGPGAGVRVTDGAQVTFNHGSITECAADDAGGGAISVAAGAHVDVTNVTLTGNSASGGGGAVRVEDGSAAFTDCLLQSNTDDGGGAVFVTQGGALELRGCVLDDNSAHRGAHMYARDGSMLLLSNTTVTGGLAYEGTALFLHNQARARVLNSSLVALPCTLRGAVAALQADSTMEVHNSSLLAASSVDGVGSALMLTGSHATLSATTLAGTTGPGAAVRLREGSTLQLQNGTRIVGNRIASFPETGLQDQAPSRSWWAAAALHCHSSHMAMDKDSVIEANLPYSVQCTSCSLDDGGNPSSLFARMVCTAPGAGTGGTARRLAAPPQMPARIVSPTTGGVLANVSIASAGTAPAPGGQLVPAIVFVGATRALHARLVRHDTVSFTVPPGIGTQHEVAVFIEGLQPPRSTSVSAMVDYEAPSLVQVYPSVLGTEGGTVLLRGSNFGGPHLAWEPNRAYGGVDAATVNGIPCASVRRVNDSALECVAPPAVGSALPVSVTVAGQMQAGPPLLLTQAAVPEAPYIQSVSVLQPEGSSDEAALPDRLLVAWLPGESGGAAVLGFTITADATPLVVVHADSSARSATLAGLTAGTTYTIAVTAHNSRGTGAAATASAALALAPTPPEITTVVAAQPWPTALAIRFVASSPRASPVTAYRVYVSRNASFVASTAHTLPVPPTPCSASPSAPASSAGGTTRLRCASSDGSEWEAVVTQLPAHAVLYVKVAGVNAVGEGAPGVTVATDALVGVPSAPRDIQADLVSVGSTSGIARLSFMRPATGRGSEVSLYKVSAVLSVFNTATGTMGAARSVEFPGKAAQPGAQPGRLQLQIEGLAIGGHYAFRVAAANIHRPTDYGDVGNATGDALVVAAVAAPPSVASVSVVEAVSLLNPGATGDAGTPGVRFEVTWSAPAAHGSAILSYTVTMQRHSGEAPASAPVPMPPAGSSWSATVATEPGTVQATYSATLTVPLWGTLSYQRGLLVHVAATNAMGPSPRSSGEEALMAPMPCVQGMAAEAALPNLCRVCPAGRWSAGTIPEGATVVATRGSADSTDPGPPCQACPSGTVAPLAGLASCQRCEDGTTPDDAARLCVPCTPGSAFSNDTRSCAPCEPGYHSSDFRAMRCTACSVGTVAEGGGNVECSTCPPGHRALTGGMACELCGAGTFATSDGRTCAQCPTEGATCRLGILIPKLGYWFTTEHDGGSSNSSSGGITTTPELHRCPEGACTTGPNNTIACAPGRMGPLCALCLPGHAGATCEQCSDSHGGGFSTKHALLMALSALLTLLLLTGIAVRAVTQRPLRGSSDESSFAQPGALLVPVAKRKLCVAAMSCWGGSLSFTLWWACAYSDGHLPAGELLHGGLQHRVACCCGQPMEWLGWCWSPYQFRLCGLHHAVGLLHALPGVCKRTRVDCGAAASPCLPRECHQTLSWHQSQRL